jgi:ornithine--oxo-acid transaminase
MIENAARVGAYFIDQLRGLRSNAIREVRGRGLMIAIELDAAAGGARRYCDALRARGVLAKDTRGNTIRISPPLVITKAEIDWALERMKAAFAELDG